MSGKANILCVGLCCLDTISQVAHYPKEDTDQRCEAQWWQRGGNAANNCTVLGLLGAKPAYLGTIANSHEKRFLLDDFAQYGISTDNVVEVDGVSCPASCVILSKATGSRTIIHANAGLPELTPQDFCGVDLKNYKWVHFEGRNVANVVKMIDHVRQHNKNVPVGQTITISLEVEKAKAELDSLVCLPDVLFVSKDYAKFKGFTSMTDTVEKLQEQVRPGCIVICPWGEEGASAGKIGELVSSPSFPPKYVIDTLGAGDTFNAATIFALSQGHNLKQSISFGCRLAGAKVGVMGWEAFGELIRKTDFKLALMGEVLGRGS